MSGKQEEGKKTEKEKNLGCRELQDEAKEAEGWDSGMTNGKDAKEFYHSPGSH